MVSRFVQLLALLASTCLMACMLVLSAQAATNNILLLIADDYGVDIAGFYPKSARFDTTPPAPPTPNLTALAKQGVLFTHAWAAPLCSPARAEMLTGRYGLRTGIGTAKTSGLPQLRQSELTLPEIFRQAAPSYTLAHIGKWHLSTGDRDPNLHGWPHYAGPSPTLGRINNYYRWPKVVDGVASTSTVYATTDTVNETLRIIQQAGATNRPYFAWVAFNAPHNPFHKPPNNLHSRDELPATGASNRAYYEAAVESLDTEIGRLLKAVNMATTTVIFVGDNGTPNTAVAKPYSGTHAKGTLYEGGMKVPLVVAGMGVGGANRAVGALVNTVDLFPTILELAGIDPKRALPAGLKFDGITMLPYLRNIAHPAPRSWIYAERFTMTFDGDWQRAIREQSYKLIERFDGTREFYNVVSDPLEKTNLLTRTLTSLERSKLVSLDLQLSELVASH